MSTASGPNTPDPRAWELLRAALDLPPNERDAFAVRACVGDAALLAELRGLLTRDAAVDSLLDAPLDPQRYFRGAASSTVAIGSTVGPYRVLAELGAGGMGTVYRAERIGGVAKHHVALKLIKRGMDSNEIEIRFLRERDILAQLQHPHIARLIDGGVSDSGQAWFAMELIEGEPIAAWCDARRLPLARRIALFLDVCAAVQYAHRNLVVHRDLKPGNVLVSGEGEVKLLDFGIAKLLTEAQDGHEQTRSQVRLLTPEFAAPEQFRGERVTTATDVYQLGLMLYELLSGRRAARPGDTGITSPPRLSAALSGPSFEGEASVEAIAAARAAGVKALQRQLRGDLSRIVAKALNDDPARRYDSAGDFADDLRRYLEGQPVMARPDSVAYRARKFVARHRVGVAATALVLVALIAASLYSAHQASVAREQAQRAEAVREFLVGVFENADPDENKGQPITAHQLLEKGEAQLTQSAAGDSAVTADLTGLIGSLYEKLGDFARAKLFLTKATGIVRDAGVPDDIKARNLNELARLELESFKPDDAIAHARQALALAESASSVGAVETLDARRMVASALIAQGKVKDGLPLLRDLIEREGVDGKVSDNLVEDYNLLCEAYENDEQTEAAAAACRAAIAAGAALHRDLSWSVSVAYNRLGVMQQRAGDYANSEKNLREALRIREQLHGADHSGTVVVHSNLLRLLEIQGRHAETLFARLEMVEHAKHNQDARPGELAYAHLFLGDDYDALGRLQEAETEYRRSLDVWTKAQGANKGNERAAALKYLAENVQRQGRYDEAETLYREVIALGEEQAASATLAAEASLGRAYLGNLLRLEHRYADALREVDAAAAAPAGAGKNVNARLAIILALQAEAQLDAGDPVKAQTTATKALSLAREAFPGRTPRIAPPLFALARADLALKRAAESESLLREALAARSPPHPADDVRVLEVQVELARALAATGNVDEARRLAAATEPLLASNKTAYAADLRARLRGVR